MENSDEEVKEFLDIQYFRRFHVVQKAWEAVQWNDVDGSAVHPELLGSQLLMLVSQLASVLELREQERFHSLTLEQSQDLTLKWRSLKLELASLKLKLELASLRLKLEINKLELHYHFGHKFGRNRRQRMNWRWSRMSVDRARIAA